MKNSTLRGMLLALLITFSLLFSSIGFTAHAAPGTIETARYAPTTTAMKLVTNTSTITSVAFTNIGSVTVFLGTTSGVTASAGASTDGTPLLAGNKVIYHNTGNNWYGITASGTGEIRVEIFKGGASAENERLQTSGISNGAANTTVGMSDGTNIVAGNVLFYMLTTAITANSTSTATAAGTLAVTSHATGRGNVFRSDGSTWQLLDSLADRSSPSTTTTIATTSTSDVYLQAPCAGVLTGIDFTSIDALAASDTNYITWTLVNLGQSGVGTTAMLAVSDANTTKSTGGSAITAVARRQLTVHGTAANLVVAKGDVLRLRATVTGTLVGTVTGARALAYFTRTV